jgi:hypothetical protein
MIRNYDSQKYQHELANKLESILQLYNEDYQVLTEWRAFQETNVYRYSPEVDIAIGPFNDDNSLYNLKPVYNEIVKEDFNLISFIQDAYETHKANMDAELYTDYVEFSFEEAINHNANARCLVAIEIENTSTKKHIMGSIVNAASLGRIGIGIGYCEKAFKAFLRIVNYLSFLRKVEKNTYSTANFFVLSKEQFTSLAEKHFQRNDVLKYPKKYLPLS